MTDQENKIDILLKMCRYCNINKLENEFYSYRPLKCKECLINSTKLKKKTSEERKEENQKYYIKNKKKIIDQNLKYYHSRHERHAKIFEQCLKEYEEKKLKELQI